ncbi:hypothetical protein HPB52_004656 [Rhipicephalus sanguineus]|uniref:Tick transposon n=1 Tax=Rhipicephalus sanguineus TaxID=34632 RepID=A0A9D4QCH1_RHISA|nr:hypothetical protein HPB52_004656 [Rhipicephalus sanguineus]
MESPPRPQACGRSNPAFELSASPSKTATKTNSQPPQSEFAENRHFFRVLLRFSDLARSRSQRRSLVPQMFCGRISFPRNSRLVVVPKRCLDFFKRSTEVLKCQCFRFRGGGLSACWRDSDTATGQPVHRRVPMQDSLAASRTFRGVKRALLLVVSQHGFHRTLAKAPVMANAFRFVESFLIEGTTRSGAFGVSCVLYRYHAAENATTRSGHFVNKPRRSPVGARDRVVTNTVHSSTILHGAVFRNEVRGSRLKARRAANREHRSALRHLSAEDCEQAWYKYLELKRHMQQLVQRKSAKSDHKKLKELTTPGRIGIQNFWSYISALDRKSPSRPTLREEATGEPASDVKKQITDYIQDVFGTPAPVAAAENSELASHTVRAKEPCKERRWGREKPLFAGSQYSDLFAMEKLVERGASRGRTFTGHVRTVQSGKRNQVFRSALSKCLSPTVRLWRSDIPDLSFIFGFNCKRRYEEVGSLCVVVPSELSLLTDELRANSPLNVTAALHQRASNAWKRGYLKTCLPNKEVGYKDFTD